MDIAIKNKDIFYAVYILYWLYVTGDQRFTATFNRVVDGFTNIEEQKALIYGFKMLKSSVIEDLERDGNRLVAGAMPHTNPSQNQGQMAPSNRRQEAGNSAVRSLNISVVANNNNNAPNRSVENAQNSAIIIDMQVLSVSLNARKNRCIPLIQELLNINGSLDDMQRERNKKAGQLVVSQARGNYDAAVGNRYNELFQLMRQAAIRKVSLERELQPLMIDWQNDTVNSLNSAAQSERDRLLREKEQIDNVLKKIREYSQYRELVPSNVTFNGGNVQQAQQQIQQAASVPQPQQMGQIQQLSQIPQNQPAPGSVAPLPAADSDLQIRTMRNARAKVDRFASTNDFHDFIQTSYGMTANFSFGLFYKSKMRTVGDRLHSYYQNQTDSNKRKKLISAINDLCNDRSKLEGSTYKEHYELGVATVSLSLKKFFPNDEELVRLANTIVVY